VARVNATHTACVSLFLRYDDRSELWYVGRRIPIADCPGHVSVGLPDSVGGAQVLRLSCHFHPISWAIDLEDAASISGAMRGDRSRLVHVS